MRVGSVCLVGLALLTAVSAVACSDSQAVQPQQNAPPPPAVPITATAVVSKDMPLEVTVIGAVEAYATVAVRAQITGELTSVNFQQGDDVQSGQELFTLDRRPLEAALQQATANLERDTAQAANARAIMQRYEELVQRGIVAREQRDTARSVVAALEATMAADGAALENAKVQLQYATIRAPISRPDGRADGQRRKPGARQRSDAARDHQSGDANLRVVRVSRGVAPGAASLYGTGRARRCGRGRIG